MLKLNAKSAADKQVIETLKAIQSERSSKSRYSVTETLKEGLNLKGTFESADGGGKFVSIDLGTDRPARAFLANGVAEDKDSYSLVVAEANGAFEYNGIKYAKGDRKFMIQ